MNLPVLKLENIEFSRRGAEKFALGPINLELHSGRVLALLGANGAGKSTLFSTMVQDLKPTAGTVNASKTAELVRQSVSLPNGVSVDVLLNYLAGQHGYKGAQRKQRVADAVAMVDLGDKLRLKTQELSGGQHRRLLIAIGLISNPGIILLDEPSAGLDLSQRAKLKKTIRKLAEVSAVVISTHIVEDIVDLATDVLHLRDGKASFYGTAEEYLSKYGTGLQGQDAWTAAFSAHDLQVHV